MYQGVTASVLRKEHDDFVQEQLFIGLASFDASIPHSSEASAQLIDNVCRNYECEFLQFLPSIYIADSMGVNPAIIQLSAFLKRPRQFNLCYYSKSIQ